MAFTVLDPDAPQSDANAYISVEEFVEHHTDRAVSAVIDAEFDDDAIQAAIVKATDYIDKRFGRRFRGYKQSRAQSLEWPRIDAYDNDDFDLDPRPPQLIKATAEYALLSLQLGRDLAPPVTPGFGVLNPDTGTSTSQGAGQVIADRSKVGPVETEKRFAQTSQTSRSSGNPLAPDLPSYPQADLWLEELLRNSVSRRLSRG